jgi:hypothetical protein
MTAVGGDCSSSTLERYQKLSKYINFLDKACSTLGTGQLARARWRCLESEHMFD